MCLRYDKRTHILKPLPQSNISHITRKEREIDRSGRLTSWLNVLVTLRKGLTLRDNVVSRVQF